MRTAKTKNGMTVNAKWALGPLDNGQLFVDLSGDYKVGEAAAMFDGLAEVVIDEGNGTEHVYRGYTELVSVQRARAKNETRLIFEKP